jgi:hypothetical protein
LLIVGLLIFGIVAITKTRVQRSSGKGMQNGQSTPSCNIPGTVIRPFTETQSTWGSGPIDNQWGYFPKLSDGKQYCSVMHGVFDKCGNYLFRQTGATIVGVTPCP